MNVQRNSKTRAGWNTRLFNITIILILIAGFVTPPGALAARMPAGSAGTSSQLLADPPPDLPDWIYQGPAPLYNRTQMLSHFPQAEQPATGAVTAIVGHPTDPNVVYVGSANGGVWKTTNATAAPPTWTPITDGMQSLSIGAMALDPADPNRLLVGTGRFSGFARTGDDLGGVYYTTDGGATWTTSTGTNNNLVKYSGNDVHITAVAARGNTLWAATSFGAGYALGGLFRTTSGPTGTWEKISGTAPLPDAPANFIAGDPTNPNVLYVGFLLDSGGIFKYEDKPDPQPDTWTKINGIPYTSATSTGFGISAKTTAMSAAVSSDGSAITVALNGTIGNLSSTTTGTAMYRSVNGGAFAALDTPAGIEPGSGAFYMLTADKTEPNLVYLAGYGANGGPGFIWRLDASKGPGAQVTRLANGARLSLSAGLSATATTVTVSSTADFPITFPFIITIDDEQMSVTNKTATTFTMTRGANGTTAAAHAWLAPVNGSMTYGAPHVDYTAMALDANGGLLAGSHGGIFRLPDPKSLASDTNYWAPLNGDLGILEIHSIAYDSISNVVLGGFQDNGSGSQTAPDSTLWTKNLADGDGLDVLVDNVTLAGSNQSLRYSAGSGGSNLSRYVFDANNTQVSSSSLSYSVIPATELTGYPSLIVNAVAPTRILYGATGHVYESFNQGSTWTAIANVGVNGLKHALAYGGTRNGIANPEVLYTGSGSVVYSRTVANGPLTATGALPSGAGTVADIVMNSADWMNVFVIDDNQVFASTDGGAAWTDITGTLVSSGLSSVGFSTIEFVSGPSPYIAVGTRSGVFASLLSNLGVWTRLGDSIPDVLVYDLYYNAIDDVLAAGTLGRGAYKLPAASAAFVPSSVAPVVTITSGLASANEGTTQTYSFTVTDPGDRFTVTGLTVTNSATGNQAAALAANSLVTTASGGSFKVNLLDGPAAASISLQVTDSTGLASNLASMSVTANNVIPTVTISGASPSPTPGTLINLTSSVTDQSTADRSAPFTYLWFVIKPTGAASIPNGSGTTFSFTPSITGLYKVYLNATDKDGGLKQGSIQITVATAGSAPTGNYFVANHPNNFFSAFTLPWKAGLSRIGSFSPLAQVQTSITADNATVTVTPGQTATNTGTYSHPGPAPMDLSASVGTVTQQQTSTTGLNILGYWQLGEDDHGAADGVAGSNPTLGRDASGLNPALDLTRSGSPTYRSSVPSNSGSTLAMSFDGSSGYSSSAPVTTATDNFGIEAWVKPTGASIYQVIAHNGRALGDGFGLAIGTNGNYLGIYGGQGTSGQFDTGVAATPNVWSHVALVRDSSETRLYVNGVLTFSNNATVSPLAATVAVTIARRAVVNGNFLSGAVDDVRVFTFAPGTFDPQDLEINTSVSGTWSWSYPTGGATQSQTVDITGSTGVSGDSASTSFQLVVNGANQAPVAADDDFLTEQETALTIAVPGVLANDTDAENDPLTATKESDPANGTLTFNGDGSFTYTPNVGFTGEDSFTYKAYDGEAYSNIATARIMVLLVNQAAEAADDSHSTTKDTPLTEAAPGVLANDTDPAANPLTAVLAGDPLNGTVILNADGSFTYTPNAGFTGADSFMYIADNGLADSNMATVAITVDNAAPTASVSGPASALAGQVVSFLFQGSDSASDQAAGFTYNVDWGDGSSQTIEPVQGNGDAVARHAFAAAGNTTVQVTATDKDGAASTTASTTITVDALNTSALQAVIANTPIVYFEPADDAALQSEVEATNGLSAPASPVDITIVLGAGPYSGMTLSPVDNIAMVLAGNNTDDNIGLPGTTLIASSSGPAVTVTRGDVYVQGNGLTTSADAPTVLVTGGHLTLAQANIQESTGANNVALEVTAGEVSLCFDILMNINGEGNFVRSYNLDAVEPPQGVDAEMVPNTFSINGEPGSAFGVSITRLKNLTGSPSVFGQPVTFKAIVEVELEMAGVATGTVSFYDGTTLLGTSSVVLENYQGGNEAESVTTLTTSDLSVGSHTITAVYSGDSGYVPSSAVLTHVVNEAPPNNVPVAANDSYNAFANTALNIAAPGILSNDTDADHDPLTAVKVSNPAHGTLTLNANGSFIYTPATNYVGSDSFTYKANDGKADSNLATVNITVKFAFTGFFQPVDNVPVENQMKAGASVPIKFSLGGNMGLNIFASGYPTIKAISCISAAPIDDIEQTTTSNSGLTYDAAAGQYIYTWKTDKKLANTCQQLTIRLTDGTDHIALFKFK